MTTLSGWIVDLTTSPRTITIPVGQETVTAQDQVDTVRKLEDTFQSMGHPHFLDATGKEGGGVTGIVVVLKDCQYAFQPRQTSLQTGTVTTGDVRGLKVIDTAALFLTNGVNRGDVIVNRSTAGHSTVIHVDSEIELETLPIVGGSHNRWDVSDSYEIFAYTDAKITSGDLFAVDSVGAPISAILNTFGIGSTVIEQSTSPAAAPIQPTTILEGTLTWEVALKRILASVTNKLSGAETTTMRFRDVDDTKDRIVATVDANGNRTAITYDDT